MTNCELILRRARVVDGSGSEPETLDIAIADGRIAAIAPTLSFTAPTEIDTEGLVLAPGFIDTHTHDDTSAIETPEMLPKISQGVTTVIIGNCGISAAPVRLRPEYQETGPPDPMTLLGRAEFFRYPTFASYVDAIAAAKPAVNVAALVGHTALRSNVMDRLDRAATDAEIAAMRADLEEALQTGAIGLQHRPRLRQCQRRTQLRSPRPRSTSRTRPRHLHHAHAHGDGSYPRCHAGSL